MTSFIMQSISNNINKLAVAAQTIEKVINDNSTKPLELYDPENIALVGQTIDLANEIIRQLNIVKSGQTLYKGIYTETFEAIKVSMSSVSSDDITRLQNEMTNLPVVVKRKFTCALMEKLENRASSPTIAAQTAHAAPTWANKVATAPKQPTQFPALVATSSKPTEVAISNRKSNKGSNRSDSPTPSSASAECDPARPPSPESRTNNAPVLRIIPAYRRTSSPQAFDHSYLAYAKPMETVSGFNYLVCISVFGSDEYTLYYKSNNVTNADPANRKNTVICSDFAVTGKCALAATDACSFNHDDRLRVIPATFKLNTFSNNPVRGHSKRYTLGPITRMSSSLPCLGRFDDAVIESLSTEDIERTIVYMSSIGRCVFDLLNHWEDLDGNVDSLLKGTFYACKIQKAATQFANVMPVDNVEIVNNISLVSTSGFSGTVRFETKCLTIEITIPENIDSYASDFAIVNEIDLHMRRGKGRAPLISIHYADNAAVADCEDIILTLVQTAYMFLNYMRNVKQWIVLSNRIRSSPAVPSSPHPYGIDYLRDLRNRLSGVPILIVPALTN